MLNVYALVGEDSFLQMEALQRIAHELGKDIQRSDFEGETAVLADVLDELRSYSMFGGHKLVVMRHADDFITRYREELEEYVAKPADSATFVLRCDSLPKTQRIAKLIDKHGKIEVCEPPKAQQLPAWIIARAKSAHDATINSVAANLLAELIGADMGRLDNELAKLALMVDGKITDKEVNQSVVFQREQEMWHMTDELSAGRIDKALTRWRQLVQADSSTEFRAMTWLTMWVEKAIKALRLKKKNMNGFAIAKELKIWPANNVDSLLRTAEKMGEKGLVQALNLLADLDLRSKSGLGDAADNVERFILSLASR